MESQFSDIVQLIRQARNNAIKAVNTELINLYWEIGAHISQKVEASEWGKSVVKELAIFIQQTDPQLKGFSDKNLWRMKQFYETYKDEPKLSPLVRELSWSHNLAIFSRCDSVEEKEFYLKISKEENYSKRELDRQISASLFERTMIGNAKLSTALRELNQDLTLSFKDSYVFDFLNLPEPHSENDLQKGLIQQMKNFILELGKDFLFVSEEYKIQVGNSDFFIDLLFYHRGLQCLVAFELKIGKFKPEYISKMDFYLEALDRQERKENENPSVGVILCASKDEQVVEYAMSRSMSPTMVSQYTLKLIDKKLLENKLKEITNIVEENNNK